MGDRAEILHRILSPDGLLVWRIEREAEADGRMIISMGFEGLSWHLHPEDFVRRNRTDEEIAADVTTALIGDRLLVLVVRDGDFHEFRLLDDIEQELDAKSNDETWVLRFWSGEAVSIDRLIDREVDYLPVSNV